MLKQRIHGRILGVFLLVFFSFTGQSDASVGKVVMVSGRVLIRNEKDPAQNMREVKTGDLLGESDVVNTSSNSKIKMMFSDQTIIDLGPSTLFKVDEYKLNSVSNRKISLSMPYGKIRAAVNKKVGSGGSFRFKAQGATMGVRGTAFLVEGALLGVEKETQKEAPKPQALKVTVEEGEVALLKSNKSESSESGPKVSKEVSIKAGQVATLEAKIDSKDGRAIASAPAEIKLEAAKQEDIDRAKSDIKIEDNKAFTDQVVVDALGGGGGSSTLEGLFEDGMGDIDLGDISGLADGFAGPAYQGPFIPETFNGVVSVRVRVQQ